MLEQSHPPSPGSQSLVQGSFLQQHNLKTDGCKTQKNTLDSVAQPLESVWARQGPAAKLAPGSTPPNGVRPPNGARQVQEAWAQKPALWGRMRDGSVPIIPTTRGPMCPGAVSSVGFWPGKRLSLLHSPSPPPPS